MTEQHTRWEADLPVYSDGTAPMGQRIRRVHKNGCHVAYISGASPEDEEIIIAAPETAAERDRLKAEKAELEALLKELIAIEGPCPGTAQWAEKVRAALAKEE